MPVSDQVRLAVGDVVELACLHHAGAALNLEPNITFLAAARLGA